MDYFRAGYPDNREAVGGFFRCAAGGNPLAPKTEWTDSFWRDVWLVFPSELAHPDINDTCTHGCPLAATPVFAACSANSSSMNRQNNVA